MAVLGVVVVVESHHVIHCHVLEDSVRSSLEVPVQSPTFHSGDVMEVFRVGSKKQYHSLLFIHSSYVCPRQCLILPSNQRFGSSWIR